MVASAARGSFGAIFYIGGTSGASMGTSTAPMMAVSEILTITAPNYTANSIDLTNQNTTEYFKEFIAGVRDPGSLSLTANYLSSATQHNQTIPNYFYGGLKMPWALYLSGTSSMNCFWGYGYVTNYTVTSPPDGAVSFAMTVKLTGKPVGPVPGTSTW